ncbi:hypothetical protein BDZ94DRAFT_1233284 [Collybia nuda]|uniref:Uncharacterized protein n=1 Tax=Collybia nuda TaxID=64659 RepID=A0A9P5YEB0_9AGAR|nr:hypothetical protein BDZ94DRAFT_1233284 [Collybia nuda]
MLSQAFTIIYLTLLVYLTQQLSLRRNLSIKQTLTATHDNSTAWTGLGSALSSLWLQTSVSASVGGVAAITLYLAGVAALKVSTPSWFTVVSFENSTTKHIQTDLGSPFITFPHDWTFATRSSALPFISQLPTSGLLANTLFDVLSTNNGTGMVEVNSTVIDVKCGALPGVAKYAHVSQYNISDTGIAKDNDSVTWEVSVPVQDLKGGTMGPNIIVISSTSIKDSAARPLYELQAIGCSLFITNQSGWVDARSKQLIKPPVQKTQSTWSSWQPVLSPDI